MNLRDQLVRLEGWEHEAYPDPLTNGDPWTIGVGHTGPEVCKGLVWTDEKIGATLAADIAIKSKQVQDALPWFDQLNEPRQAVLIGMCFQMGIGSAETGKGLLGFVRTLAAVRDAHYALAADGLRSSRWAKQTPRRANLMARQIETGAWQ